jgi:hypothetical protein
MVSYQQCSAEERAHCCATHHTRTGAGGDNGTGKIQTLHVSEFCVMTGPLYSSRSIICATMHPNVSEFYRFALHNVKT